jgi:hypothetical protein
LPCALTYTRRGLVDMNVCGVYYSGTYPVIQDSGKTAIDLDLITVDHVWYARVNGREVGRGPMFFPPEHKKVYTPFVHMCGISGEVTHLSQKYIE